jgi:YbbR domain-containing protein
VAIRSIFVKTPDGYRVGSTVIEPDKLWIRGPEERVNNISQVLTDPVDLTGVVSQKEFRTRVNVGDPLVRLEAPEVTVKVTLERAAPGRGR